LPTLIEQWNKHIGETSKRQYKSIYIYPSFKFLAYKVLNPLETAEKDKGQTLEKIEKILDSIYQDKSITSDHYTEFMQNYMQDFEEKVKANPEYKFEYKKSELVEIPGNNTEEKKSV